MNFFGSAEVFQPAYPALDKVRRCVVPLLNAAFEASSLGALEATLRYIPIVMPDGMRERYPARSKLRRKQRVYDCSPQLNYEVFVEGSFEEQLYEYILGISLSLPHLADLGASSQQIEDFDFILNGLANRIISDELDMTRH